MYFILRGTNRTTAANVRLLDEREGTIKQHIVNYTTFKSDETEQPAVTASTKQTAIAGEELVASKTDLLAEAGFDVLKELVGELAEISPSPQPCATKDVFLARNSARLAHVQTKCGQYDRSVQSTLSRVYENWYFPESDLSWCPMFKCASTNTLSRFCLDYFPASKCTDKKHNGAMLYRYNQIFTKKTLGSAPLFTVVRDPFRRLLSAYRDKFEPCSGPRYRWDSAKMMVSHRSRTFLEKSPRAIDEPRQTHI